MGGPCFVRKLVVGTGLGVAILAGWAILKTPAWSKPVPQVQVAQKKVQELPPIPFDEPTRGGVVPTPVIPPPVPDQGEDPGPASMIVPPFLPAEWAAKLPKIEEIKPLPASELPDEPPHEGAMFNVPMPIQPPDILIIEVLEALPGRPIQGERLVRPDGTITLGYYGDLYVRGLTAEQAKTKVTLHLRKFLNDHALGLIGWDSGTLNPEPAPKPPVGRLSRDAALRVGLGDPAWPGRDLVTTALRPSPPRVPAGASRAANPPKRFRVARFQVPEARELPDPTRAPAPRLLPQPAFPAPAAEGKLVPIPPAESDRVFVDISSYNSTVFYVLGAVQTPGRLPYTGSETVLDAIQYAGGLSEKADASTLRIARRAWGKKPAQVLKVDLDAIRDRGDSKANYQILPGDRLVVDPKS